MSILGSMSNALNKPAQQVKSPAISTQTPAKDNSNTMAGNVANILNGNSLLMNSAAAKGERLAAGRGLQNSTIGAEASQRAMLDAAMPIASQDTQNAFTLGHTRLQSDLNYQNQSRLNQQQSDLAKDQASHQSKLNYDVQRNLNEQQNTFAEKQTRLQSDLNYQNQSRLNQAQNQFTASQTALDRTHQRDLANLNHQNEMKNLNAQVSANTIGKSIDFTMQITNNFDAQIAAILNNTNMKEGDKNNAIKMLKESRDSELNFMSRFMQGIPTTQQNWSTFPNLGVPTVSINK